MLAVKFCPLSYSTRNLSFNTTGEPQQDTKKGKLRFYHGPIFWNYGYIPQTWEDPGVKHPEVSDNLINRGIIYRKGDSRSTFVVNINEPRVPHRFNAEIITGQSPLWKCISRSDRTQT